MSGPRNCALPAASARFWCTSAASSVSAGIATSVSPSSYGDVTVRISGWRATTSDPSPTRVGRNGTRHAAACSPSSTIPSSNSSASIVPACRAARKCGSSAIESSDTNAKTTLRTLPVAHSRPTSGPPYETNVKSRSDERAIARTNAIGLRREPQPPMPSVIPSRSSPTTSSMVSRLSGIRLLPLVTPLDERVARLVARACEVELEREALLEPVGPAYVDRVDAVERLLRRTDHDRVDLRDLRRDLPCARPQPVARHDLEHAAVRRELLRGSAFGGVDHVPHPVLRHQPGQVCRRTQRSLLDLGQAERGVVGRDHDVRVAGQADAATETETVYGGDHRDGALIDRGERREATAVGPDQRREAVCRLHLLDVDAGVEAFALGRQHNDVHVRIGARIGDHLG